MIKRAYTVEDSLEQVGEVQTILEEYGDFSMLSVEACEIIAKNFSSATDGWLNQQSMCARAEDKLRELGK